MQLHTPHTYSLLQHGLVQSYPSLQEDINTDVLVIGAGISGALTAYALTLEGVACTVIDRRHVATGSTAASTSLVQYEIDIPLRILQQMRGKQDAVRAYILAREAIYHLEKICNDISAPGLFQWRKSVQAATWKKHCAGLVEEAALRKSAGFDVAYMDAGALLHTTGMHAPGGLWNAVAAQVDAYLLAHKLLAFITGKGNRVYDHTEAVEVSDTGSEVRVVTKDERTIRAHKLVIACGYESQGYTNRNLQTLFTTYAMVTEQMQPFPDWKKDIMLWETGMPYCYMRHTSDGRILLGGKDTPYRKDAGTGLLKNKVKSLEKAFSKWFPGSTIKNDISWAGIFAQTPDGLPYIGQIAGRPHTYFALGYGGNGITFSVLAARLISQLICKGKADDAALFSFNRT